MNNKTYLKRTHTVGDTKEVEKTISSVYGRSIPRQDNFRETPKSMEEVNERNAVTTLRRILSNNFENGDFHIVLTYAREVGADLFSAKEYLARFHRLARTLYRAHDTEYKYVANTEVGKSSNVHHHLVINAIPGKDPYRFLGELADCWGHGRMVYSCVYTAPDFGELAAYLLKKTSNTFYMDIPGAATQRYNCSRNLYRPEPVIEEVAARTWRKNPRPIKGYYIDEHSIINRECPFTGIPSQFYRMIKLEPQRNLNTPAMVVKQGFIERSQVALMKSILFNTQMVQAILSGQKTQTRRVINPPQNSAVAGFFVRSNAEGTRWVELHDEHERTFDRPRYLEPQYAPGDILYVRETFADVPGSTLVYYRADNPRGTIRWKPSIHMPRRFARLFLQVTAVRTERLQDITPKECGYEGVSVDFTLPLGEQQSLSFDRFATLWNATVTENRMVTHGWNANPWVWVYEFERVEGPEGL